MTNSPDPRKAANAKDGPEKRSRRQRHSFSPEIAELICDRIAEGWSLRKICEDPNMPARSTIFGWLEEHEDFARRYTLARQIQIEDLLDEILEIADDSSNDWIEREGPDGKKS
jgi:IS30 family transposase